MNANPRNSLRSAASWLALSVAAFCGCQISDTADCETLKQLGHSTLNYKDYFQHLPPPVVLDEGGSPKHSWRVLLLPFVEANAFYASYETDVAWDEPANADLADGSRRHPESSKFQNPTEVRRVYQPHLNDLSLDDFTTDFLMVVDGDEPLTSKTGVGLRPDGGGWRAPDRRNPDELIIVQVRKSGVHWMEPRDIVLTSPAPDWGVSFDEIKPEVIGSVLVSGEHFTCSDREATLKLIAARRSKTSRGTDGT